MPDRHFLFPLTIGPDETAAVFLRVQSTAGMTLPIRILSDRALSLKAIRDYTVYGILFGFLALVLVYFIAVSSCLSGGTCLWFSLYSLFFGLHTMVRGGFMRLLMPDELIGINNILNLLIIGGLYFTGAKFFRVFLSLKNHAKPFDLIMAVFQYLSIPFVLFPLFPNPLTPLISFFLLVINPVFSISLSFYLWRKGVPNAGYFAFGWMVAHLVSVYDFFRINGMLPYTPFGEWPIPLSLLIALLFFSAALIRRNTMDLLMARIDPLTGLANRRKFDEALEGEWNRCLRQRTPLSLIMADVDHFKDYNDSFGHKAGDQRLCHIADTMKRHARRAGDLAVRYGGEEFVLLLPNLDAASAFNLAETIRNSMEHASERTGTTGAPKNITISFGVATMVPKEGKKPESLVLDADRAMYEAKRGGRNRTVSSSSSGTVTKSEQFRSSNIHPAIGVAKPRGILTIRRMQMIRVIAVTPAASAASSACRYWAVHPPSMTITCPVVHEDASAARYRTSGTTSASSAARFRGISASLSFGMVGMAVAPA